jgi:dienelactone hydrolase
VSQCQQIADATTQAGGQVTVKVYPDSSHGFDGNPANTSAFYAGMAESFTKCAVVVEADGQETYDGKTYPANGDAILQAMRKSCIHKGASFWTNVRQKQAATQDIVAFLNLALAP